MISYYIDNVAINQCNAHHPIQVQRRDFYISYANRKLNNSSRVCKGVKIRKQITANIANKKKLLEDEMLLL